MVESYWKSTVEIPREADSLVGFFGPERGGKLDRFRSCPTGA